MRVGSSGSDRSSSASPAAPLATSNRVPSATTSVADPVVVHEPVSDGDEGDARDTTRTPWPPTAAYTRSPTSATRDTSPGSLTAPSGTGEVDATVTGSATSRPAAPMLTVVSPLPTPSTWPGWAPAKATPMLSETYVVCACAVRSTPVPSTSTPVTVTSRATSAWPGPMVM